MVSALGKVSQARLECQQASALTWADLQLVGVLAQHKGSSLYGQLPVSVKPSFLLGVLKSATTAQSVHVDMYAHLLPG